MRVGLFITCYNDLLFPEVGQATVALLRRLGVEVDFPEGQTCCGQLHFNTGYRADATALVERFVRTFEKFEAIVTPSPSCAAMVRQHHPLLAEAADRDGRSDESPARVGALTPRVYELTEFLVDVLGTVDVGARFPGRVTFHPTCHGRRLLGIGDRPTRLLSAVRELELIPLPNDDVCCGFGGTFAVKNADTSVAMGLDKLADVATTEADVLTAADTSCLMHIAGLLSRRHSPVQVLHLAQILAAND